MVGHFCCCSLLPPSHPPLPSPRGPLLPSSPLMASTSRIWFVKTSLKRSTLSSTQNKIVCVRCPSCHVSLWYHQVTLTIECFIFIYIYVATLWVAWKKEPWIEGKKKETYIIRVWYSNPNCKICITYNPISYSSGLNRNLTFAIYPPGHSPLTGARTIHMLHNLSWLYYFHRQAYVNNLISKALLAH